MKWLSSFIKSVVLKDFFRIDLSSVERMSAEESVDEKYTPVLLYSFLIGLMMLPAVVFLHTNVLVSVLIPITMVTGTAWYAISLANVKRKFQSFGLVLTKGLFKSFVGSLVILGLLAVFSFLSPLLPVSFLAWGKESFAMSLIAAIFGICAVGSILWNIFVGSIQYDVNDSMLTGQTEVAEKFFRRSLSILYIAAEHLRVGKGLEVANYYIGVAFYEVFQYIKATGVLNGKLEGLMEDALKLKRTPNMLQATADEISIRMIEQFTVYALNVQGSDSEKSYANILDELASLKNKEEPQPVVDTRLSVIFEEMANLLELQGESLFRKR